MHRSRSRGALHRGARLLCLVLAWGAFPGNAVAASRTEELRFAMRRAALELAAGRAESAAGVLRELQPDSRGKREEQEAALLWAEAELLAGNASDATALLRDLGQASSGFVRAQAAAHALALAAPGPDSLAAHRARQFLQASRDYSGSQRQDAAAGFVMAVSMLQRSGDLEASSKAFSSLKGTARSLCQLLQAEAQLARGESGAAEEQFREAARSAAQIAKAETLAAWLEGAARLGQVRTCWLRGDTLGALAPLRQPFEQMPLSGYASLFEAQIRYAAGDLAAAAEALERCDLGAHDGVHAAEAALLRIQIAIDRGRFGAADSLATALAADLPARLDPLAALDLPRELRLDLHAWHVSRTRASLDALVGRDVLRHPIRGSHLDEAAILRFARPVEVDSAWAGLTLLEPYRHESPLPEEAPYRAAATTVQRARDAWGWRERDQRQALRSLAIRQELLERAARELAAQEAALEALTRASDAMDRSLADYEMALAAQENAWLELLHRRLETLQAALETITLGRARLEARYPEDRSVRKVEETARARQALEEARTWIAALEELQRDMSPRVDGTVQAILHQYEPAHAAALLAGLRQRLLALQEAMAALRQALQEADALERARLAAAEARWRDATLELAASRDSLNTARGAFAHEAVQRLEARRAAYVEAAEDAGATAAFLAAVEDPTGSLDERRALLEHAVARLQDFVNRFPAARRADEALYRLGEVHLRLAGVEHQLALEALASAQSPAPAVALPVERYADALDAYTRLLADFPASGRIADAHFQMGFLYAEMGAPEASSLHLQAFLQAAPPDEPRRGPTALRLGENFVLLDDLDAAFDAYALASNAADEESRALGRLKLAWCAYELDRVAAARSALHALLEEAAAGGTASTELQPEALELLALCFAADHRAHEAAAVLDSWGRPAYDFALLRRMAQLFASRALYDEAIETDRILLERHPLHPFAPAVALDEIRLVEIRQGRAAAHEVAAERAALFAPHGAWAEHAAQGDSTSLVQPAWQSRLLEEDRERSHADSLAQALTDPAAAAALMAQQMRSAAIYSHQQARSASATTSATSSRAAWQQAALLYRRTLDLFPGAEGEPTTWLYLGETLFALEQPTAAADAYAAASSHASADSTTRLEASRLELAALDRAAAAEPQLLERFAARSHAYVSQAPDDPHGHDALERVGQLAFDAGRYDMAASAYTELAARTPEPQRAVLALKSVGDTWWRRDAYVRAADQYAVALQHARTSQTDSLAQVLSLLVPGALFRGAQAAEEEGEPANAAALFERLADEHAGFESSDQALYRAAQLRASLGDTARAESHFTRLAHTYPGSSLHPDALLELAGLQAAHGENAAAAGVYAQLADLYPEHPQARASRFRAAELHETSGNSRAADSAYAKLVSLEESTTAPDTALVAQLWMRRARLAATPTAALPHYTRALHWESGLPPSDRAEACFHLAEDRRGRYEALSLDPPLVESLGRKKAALEEALTAYAQVLQGSVEPWHAAACLRVGECLTHLGAALEAAPAPPELAEADLETYTQAMASQAEALEARAIEVWGQGLQGARAARSDNEWVESIESRLHPVLARRIPLQPEPLFVVVQPSR